MDAPSGTRAPSLDPPPLPWWRPRRALVIALALSIGVHIALSVVPDEDAATPDEAPLTATIRELPPPPSLAAATPPPKPQPRPRPRPAPAAPAEAVAPVPEPVPEAPAQDAAAKPTPEAPPTAEPATAPLPPVLAEDVDAPPSPVVERKTLPPRVDLGYKVYYGTQGFLIGQATYRFEHAGNRYRIGIVGDARGLAALLFRGQGRVESRGLITPDGLQPHELVVDKFNKRGRERAEFDWENGIANLHDNKTAPLELPTFDLLALMWQFYFQPPESGVQTFALATTKRVYRITGTRKRRETLEWANGPIETEMWHRTSEDGKTEGYAWFAPSLRWLPVKVRAETPRGTVEVLLDSIRIDEAAAAEPEGPQPESRGPLADTPLRSTGEKPAPEPPRYEHTP